MNPNLDKELQAALLNHPAIKEQGVSPFWRIAALLGWAIVIVLVVVRKYE